MPSFKGVSHIDLTVRDVDRSVAWHERVLCMTPLGELGAYPTPGVPARVLQVMNMDTGMTFGLMQHDVTEDGDFSEFHVGLDHVALNAGSRDDLEEWIAHLDDCEVPHSGIKDMPYGSLVIFRDPDNIQLELFALAPNFRIDID